MKMLDNPHKFTYLDKAGGDSEISKLRMPLTKVELKEHKVIENIKKNNDILKNELSW